MSRQPVAGTAATKQMTAQLAPSEREVGHHGKHEVGVGVLHEQGIDNVEVAVHAMRAGHIVHIDTEGKPVVERIVGLDAQIDASEKGIGFIDTSRVGTLDGGRVHTALDADSPLGIDRFGRQTEEECKENNNTFIHL